MARPRQPEHLRRTRKVNFRVTEREFARLMATAAAANMRLSQLARSTILSRSERIVVETHTRNDPALLKRLDRIGHNLNQLVKNAHIFGRVSPQVEALCCQISTLIEQAMREDDSR